MTKAKDTQQVWEAIRRNPRLDNLIQHLFRSEEAEAMFRDAEREESERDLGQQEKKWVFRVGIGSHPPISARKGSTPYLDEASASEFLKSIDCSTIVGLRDRALIALMTFSFARIEAAVSMNIEDYYQVGKKWKINLHEKGGKQHDMPAHHKLEEYLDAYIEAAGGFDEFPEEDKFGRKKPRRPLFRTSRGRQRPPGELTNRRMHRVDAWRMIRRRAKDAGLRMEIGNHTFRATGITNYMTNGGDLKKARDMANHASTKTTSVYDHSGDDITLDEVERITIGS